MDRQTTKCFFVCKFLKKNKVPNFVNACSMFTFLQTDFVRTSQYTKQLFWREIEIVRNNTYYLFFFFFLFHNISEKKI